MTIIDSQLETTASRNDAVIENSTANNYVTVSVSRDVVAGREADYEAWISEITTESSRFSGHLGVNVIRPSLGSRGYTIIYRFDNMDHAKAWQHSSQRQMWMEKIDGMIECLLIFFLCNLFAYIFYICFESRYIYLRNYLSTKFVK